MRRMRRNQHQNWLTIIIKPQLLVQKAKWSKTVLNLITAIDQNCSQLPQQATNSMSENSRCNNWGKTLSRSEMTVFAIPWSLPKVFHIQPEPAARPAGLLTTHTTLDRLSEETRTREVFSSRLGKEGRKGGGKNYPGLGTEMYRTTSLKLQGPR